MRLVYSARAACAFAAVVATSAWGQTLPVIRNAQEIIAQDRADQLAVERADALVEQRGSFHQLQEQNYQPVFQGLRSADLGIWFGGQSDDPLVITDLTQRGAFAQAGFREGDRIVSVDGHPISTETELLRWLGSPPVFNRMVNVLVERNGQRLTLQVLPARIGVVADEPLYQAGLLLDSRTRDRIVVERVFLRTSAYYAGLRAGDIVTGFNGKTVSDPLSFAEMLNVSGPTHLLVSRNGRQRQLTIELHGGGSRTAALPRERNLEPTRSAATIR